MIRTLSQTKTNQRGFPVRLCLYRSERGGKGRNLRGRPLPGKCLPSPWQALGRRSKTHSKIDMKKSCQRHAKRMPKWTQNGPKIRQKCDKSDTQNRLSEIVPKSMFFGCPGRLKTVFPLQREPHFHFSRGFPKLVKKASKMDPKW